MRQLSHASLFQDKPLRDFALLPSCSTRVPVYCRHVFLLSPSIGDIAGAREELSCVSAWIGEVWL